MTRLAQSSGATGDPQTILLLHGQPGRGSDWDLLVSAIDGRARTLVIDRPGWDGSSAAGGLERSADAALAALDAARVRQATIVGHSYGAAVAAWIAALHPERVRCLVLIAPAANVASLQRIDHLLAAPVAGYIASAALLVAGGLVIGMPAIRRRLAAALAVREDYLRASGSWMRRRAAWDAFFVEQRALVRDLPVLECRLRRITAPTTIVMGAEDSITRPRCVRLLAEQIAGARLIEIERGKHMLPEQIPDRLAEIVLAASAGGPAVEQPTERWMAMSSVPTIELSGGNAIPQLGFGVFQIAPPDTARAVLAALEVGYRHIDTAQMYGNERGVGEAIRASGLTRAEVFVTSKLNNGFHRPEDARRAFAGTLTELGFDYVDLFLIHWPLPTRYGGDFVSTWKTLLEFERDGRARSIGVSNFQVEHLVRLASESDQAPAVNQIELHPYLLNEAVRSYGEAHGIATEAWSPLARGAVVQDPVIRAIASEVGRTPAQVVLRWQIERGNIVFPKSVTPARIAENFQLFDFGLTSDQITRIDALDRGEAGRTGPNPETFALIPS